MQIIRLFIAVCALLLSAGIASAADPRGQWRVEDAANGRNGDYHPTPWTFVDGGIVHARPHWSGHWAPMAGGDVFVMIVGGGRVVDSFRLVFDQGGFAARKNGRDYRYAIRQGSSGGTASSGGQGGGIRILSATYGGNCGAANGNVTPHIASACTGKSRCDYVVDYKVIGDPVQGCAKDYRVRYACGSGSERQASVPKEAGYRKTVTLQCGAVASPPATLPATARAITVQSATYGGNCGAPGGNATAHIAAACNGRAECGYVIDYKVIGDPVVGCGKDYRVDYGCGDGRTRSATASPEAGFRKRIDLNCRR